MQELLTLTEEELELFKSYRRKQQAKQLHLVTSEERAASRKYTNRRRQLNPIQACIVHWRSGAKERGIEWSLTDSYLLALAANTSVCPVLGLPLVYERYTGKGYSVKNPNRASLDRIDSSKGYVEGNVWILSWRANKLKQDATLDELEKLVLALRKKQGDGNDGIL